MSVGFPRSIALISWLSTLLFCSPSNLLSTPLNPQLTSSGNRWFYLIMILSCLKPWSKLPVSYRVRPSPSEWYPSLSLYLKPQQHCSSPSTPSPVCPQPLWAPSCSLQTPLHSFRSQGPQAILCPAYGSLLQAALVSSVSPPTPLCLSLIKLIISFALDFLRTLHIHF